MIEPTWSEFLLILLLSLDDICIKFSRVIFEISEERRIQQAMLKMRQLFAIPFYFVLGLIVYLFSFQIL